MGELAILRDIGILASVLVSLATAGITLYKLGGAVTHFKTLGLAQETRMDRIEKVLEKMGNVVTDMAVERKRLDTLYDSVSRLERWWDELRRGEGMVLPIHRSAYELPEQRQQQQVQQSRARLEEKK
jgi:acyl carrier protein phosphodiesterase